MADYQYLDGTGVIVPDTSTIQNDVKAEYLAAFGANMPTDPETPQGVLIAAEALARAQVVANNAAVANQINPNVAGGAFLEAICRLTGFDPPAATPTTVTGVALAGSPNITIPAGSQANTGPGGTGDAYVLLSGVTLDNTGHGVGTFQSVALGVIPAPAAAWYVAAPVLGWDTVNATGAEVDLGVASLSDAALRTLRANTLALQGIGLAEATMSALYNTTGVQSLQFRENVAGTTQTIDGISLVAHSIWVCVQGGTDAAVAASLLNSKSMGCNWNGSTSVNVTDPTSGQTYPVKFDRPSNQNVWARVTYKTATVVGDAPTLIQNAVLDYANGNIASYEGFTVGADVSPFEIAGAVATEIPGIFIVKVEVSTDGTTWQTTEIDLAINQLAVITAARILVVAV